MVYWDINAQKLVNSWRNTLQFNGDCDIACRVRRSEYMIKVFGTYPLIHKVEFIKIIILKTCRFFFNRDSADEFIS